MKTAITFLLEEYADWEGAYITSTLNQKEGWQNKTASIQSEVTSIGGLKTKKPTRVYSNGLLLLIVFL